MNTRISNQAISRVLKKALEISIMDKIEDSSVVFYDMDFLEERLTGLKLSFPKDSLHAIAVKANPLIKILEFIRKSGNGLEVASLPELQLALKTGFSAEKIVFDSPAKTMKEIEYALELGVHLNADSFAELDRIALILNSKSSNSKIGIRINPQIGVGAIQSTSVAGKISKFGIPIENNSEKLTEYFLKNKWLRAVHLHIGSQGFPINMLVDGIEKVFNLSKEVNKKLAEAGADHRINTFDMGGGLGVSYHPDQETPGLEEFISLINKRIPELFNSKFQIITEFGRYIHANSAWVASRVEYVKKEKDHNIIMTHLGADFFLRKSYNPNDWHHEISIADSRGRLKTGDKLVKYTVAGPLCFAGDIIARDIEIPEVMEGDYLIIHDVGAYNLSMWSRYNSRQIPLVLGYSEEKNEFSILKKREKLDDLYEFWK